MAPATIGIATPGGGGTGGTEAGAMVVPLRKTAIDTSPIGVSNPDVSPACQAVRRAASSGRTIHCSTASSVAWSLAEGALPPSIWVA